ncbi:MAG: hypothetical protein WC303_01910 [Candidatus Paceibacterota bacterium]
MPKITNVEEAREAYNRFYQVKDSEKRNLSLQEWNRFYLPRVQKAIQDKDLGAFFGIFTSGYMPPAGEARDIARASMDLFVSMISTPEQARDIYKMFPYNDDLDHWVGHDGKITERWDQLSFLEIERASSIAEIKTAADNAFRKRKSFIMGMLKWVEACQTVGEINKLLDYAKGKGFNNSLFSEAIRKRADSLLLSETPKVIDIKTIKSHYCLASRGSAIEIFVFEKWLDLCTTPEEANEAFISSPKGKVVCQRGL